jgi:competence protein ComEC
MSKFSSFPLLRLLIPFIIGILCYVYHLSIPVFVKNIIENFYYLFFIVVIVIALSIVQFFFNIKYFFSFIVDGSLFLFGYGLSYYQDLLHRPDFVGNFIKENEYQYIIVKPTDVIVHKEGFNKLIVDSYLIYDKDQHFQKAEGKILIYLPADTTFDAIYHPNAYYLLSAQLKSLKHPENPYVFDYANYLKKQSVYFTANIKRTKEFQFLSYKKFWSIKDWALYVRYYIVQYFQKNTYLSKHSKAIATALLTGFDDELDNDIIRSFAYSGTLHILSVSGFHTGLLFLLINFIFSFIDPYKNKKWWRIIITISCLFFYAFISGFSPPIVRAAIMLSLVLIQQYIYTDRIIHTLNILSAAAFFVLVINPLFINDVGFLLSFSAIIGLAYFSPKVIFENRFIQSIWDIVSMSIGAQVATLPFTLYYFHGFAFLFIISNIIIIPLSTIIMFVALLALFSFSYFSILLNYLIQLLLYLNSFLSTSYTYYDWIHFTWIDAIFLSGLIILSGLLIPKIFDREISIFKYINAVLILLILWINGHFIFQFFTNDKKAFYLYTDKKQTYYWIQKNQSIVFNTLDSIAINYWAKNLLLKSCYKKYSIYPFNYVIINGKKIFIADKERDTSLIQQLKPNIIIWKNKRKANWEKFYHSELQKIYWIKKQSTQTLDTSKVSIIQNGKWLMF